MQQSIVKKLLKLSANLKRVAYSTDYKYMCSDPGQTLIKDAIKEHKLTGVVVAACSPRMHEPTFRKACAEAGLNPFCAKWLISGNIVHGFMKKMKSQPKKQLIL